MVKTKVLIKDSLVVKLNILRSFNGKFLRLYFDFIIPQIFKNLLFFYISINKFTFKLKINEILLKNYILKNKKKENCVHK